VVTDYRAIAEQYARAKQHPWRAHIEAFTLFDLLGDLAGRSVLDLACGTGFYSRALRRHGAPRVLGVDRSERMVELARQEEARDPLGVEYLVHDAEALALGETFDVVVAAYLLNYARTREELLAMYRAVHGALKPAGRFLAVNDNPDYPPERSAEGRQYGFRRTVAGEPREGAPILWRFFLEDGTSFEVTNYLLSRATHEEALRSAGLRDPRWHDPRLSPAGEAEYGREFWAAFLDHPPVIFLEVVK
jgi:SAM-dependent methyltransferase